MVREAYPRLWVRAVRVMLLAVLVGIMAGFGISFFLLLIQIFLGVAQVAREITGPRWVFLVPVTGMLVTAIMVKRMGPHGFGHGFPEVIDAVFRRRSKVPAGLTLTKMLASALCIAWGGVVGRIGPVTHVGAMLGSVIGRVFKVPTHLLRLLLGCGAAAAISATFNAPLAGVLFASEVVLRQFNVDVIVPLVVASVIGSSVPRPIIGQRIAFDVPVFHSLGAAELPLFIVLGLLAGCLATFFIKSLGTLLQYYPRLKIGWYGRAIMAGLVIGMAGMMYPEILLINHGMTTEFLHGGMNAWLLLAIAVLLPVMTGLTLAGGGSGGVFAPSLAMGAALGGSFGSFAQYLPWDVSAPGAYAVVGAAAVLAGAVRSPITAMVLVMEVTGNHTMLLPLMAASVCSIFLSRSITYDSVLTVTRHDSDSDAGWVNLMRDIYVDEIMETEVNTIPASLSLADIREHAVAWTENQRVYVVEQNGRLVGSLRGDQLDNAPKGKEARAIRVRDIARPERYLLTRDADALGAFHEFGIRSAPELPVVNNLGERILIGSLSRTNLLERYHAERQLQLRI